MKVSELTGTALDYAVSKVTNQKLITTPNGKVFVNVYGNVLCADHDWLIYSPSTRWEQGGPIIGENGITLVCAVGEYSTEKGEYETFWVADIGAQTATTVYGSQGDEFGTYYQVYEDCITGNTPLVAAMRCLVAFKFGDTIKIPEELLK